MSGISLCRFSGGEGGEARILAAIGGRSSSAASSSCRSRLHPHLTPVRSLSSPYALGCFLFSMLIRPPVSDCWFPSGVQNVGREVASLGKRVGGRLLRASCVARVACSGHEGVM